jgi:hypothetical protein
LNHCFIDELMDRVCMGHGNLLVAVMVVVVVVACVCVCGGGETGDSNRLCSKEGCGCSRATAPWPLLHPESCVSAHLLNTSLHPAAVAHLCDTRAAATSSGTSNQDKTCRGTRVVVVVVCVVGGWVGGGVRHGDWGR